MAAADMPFPEMEFDDLEFNIDLDALPIMETEAPVKPAGSARSALPLSGTHPISLRVEARVIRAFKVQAAKTGVSYQGIMNYALRQAAAGFV